MDFDFHELAVRIIKITTNFFFKCFTLHVMNLEFIEVSVFEMLPKKNFSRYSNFLDAPVYSYSYIYINIFNIYTCIVFEFIYT